MQGMTLAREEKEKEEERRQELALCLEYI